MLIRKNIIIGIFIISVSFQAYSSGTKAIKKPVKKQKTIQDLQKEIAYLKSEIIKLWKLSYKLKKLIPTKKTIKKLINQQTYTILKNKKYKTVRYAKKLPPTKSTGNVNINFLVIGSDRAQGEKLTKRGIRIAYSLSGPRFYGNSFVVLYAMPINDLTMKPKYIIYFDNSVPYLNGITQSHFIWDGKFLKSKTKAPKGTYKIFARIIVKNLKNKIAGTAMRFWGKGFAKNLNKYIIKIN